MKKFFVLALLPVLVFASCASAEVIGAFIPLNNTAAQFQGNNLYNKIMFAGLLADGITAENISLKSYDSMMLMQMALNKGEIDSISMPEVVGDYILRNAPECYLRGFLIMRKFNTLSFGFLDDKAELRGRFNKVLDEMQNGALGLLVRDYVTGPYADNPPAIEFTHFDGAETINVGVTGDLPPIDYVAADGTPAGFNTALLAEIGRRLQININLVNVETGARLSALKSGRIDVVFWVAILGENFASGLPEGIIISSPYYGWNKLYFIGKK